MSSETGSDPLVGRLIGHYRLLERIGEGGMGVVYLAERADEFKRRVAVKLVRYAMDAPKVRGRFQGERQMLATLSHPNIVALLDGGATEEGLPYLVMEHVEGTPIGRYCAQRGLRLAERLTLFLQVCAAVEHAHRHLVIHCDLKPSNILVTAEGVPKLLDFGIAKLLGPRPAEDAYLTVGRRPFTARYASPEQLLGKPITTASDVYSLGVILFELLTEHSPYPSDTHSDAEVIGAVCYQEPPKPSASAAAEARRLAGDLDAIVLKALRKEPLNRYGSVEQFSADLRRHLEGRPVTALQGNLRYRTGKFVVRNKVGVAASAAAALALLVGVGGIAWEGRVAVAARARAERRFNDVRTLANFLLFDFHDAVQKLPGSTPVQEMLVRRSLQYLDGLAREASGDPGLEVELAEAYVRLGDVQGNPYMQNLGDASGALASYQKALDMADELARSAPGNRRAGRAQARAHQRVGDVLFLRREMRGALAHTRQATAAFERLVAEEPRDVEARTELAASLDGLGDQLSQGLGDASAALAVYKRSLGEWRAVLGLDPRHLRAQRALASLNMKVADVEAAHNPRAALATYQAALAALDELPASEQSAVASRRLKGVLLRKMADAQWEAGDRLGCLENYRRATEVFASLAALDPSNARAWFDYAVVLNNAGESYAAMGDLAAALGNYGKVANILETLIRGDPSNTSWRAHLAEILVRIGGLLQKTGQGVEARRQTARGLQTARELGERPQTPAPELIRAARLLAVGEPAELRDPPTAVRFAERAVKLTEGADAYALDTLAEAYLAAGNAAGARDAIQKGLALLPATPGQPGPWLRQRLEAKLGQVNRLAAQK